MVGNGPIFGIFVNSAGNPVTGGFPIMSGQGWGHFPRAKYSPDAGGFLVTWHADAGGANFVFGRMVHFPGGPSSGIAQISDGQQGGSWWETGPPIAYSRSSGRFLVAWRTIQYGIHGRFVDNGGNPSGGVMAFENPGGSRDPALAWNPATNEFGVGFTGWSGNTAHAGFRRVNAGGGVSGRTTFGFGGGTFSTGLDVNSSNQYVLAWSVHPGTRTATFDQNGNLLGENFITSRFGHDQSMGLAYNPSTGSFLAVGSDGASLEVAGAEVNGGGGPQTGAQIITEGAGHGSFHPLTASRPGTNQWDVVYSRDFRGATNQIIGSGGGGGGTPPPPPPPPPPPDPDAAADAASDHRRLYNI